MYSRWTPEELGVKLGQMKDKIENLQKRMESFEKNLDILEEIVETVKRHFEKKKQKPLELEKEES